MTNCVRWLKLKWNMFNFSVSSHWTTVQLNISNVCGFQCSTLQCVHRTCHIKTCYILFSPYHSLSSLSLSLFFLFVPLNVYVQCTQVAYVMCVWVCCIYLLYSVVHMYMCVSRTVVNTLRMSITAGLSTCI